MQKNTGSWAGMRRRPTCKSIRVNEAGMPDTKNSYYVVKKKYGSHPHCEPPLGLMKCLSYLTRDGHPIGNAVLSYKCLENCRLQPRPHGNSKRRQNIPYMRTYPSTLMKVREQLNSRSPAAVWNELSMDSSGHSDVQAILRDRKQVYNARMPRRKSSDPETLDEINFLKSRLAALEEQNNKLIYTNASLMELVNDLRMMELPHSRLMAYSVQPVEHSTPADVYKQEAETQVRGRKRCVQECHLRNPSNVNQSTCFSAVPGHGY
ncbi:unnamed protein product [Gongylonema pulchrum]|uniref:Dystrobrevin alpha n=1 Tax=Gongylonema pulchrum TaxID=637853 RepID=A0A183DVH2_9BILA|nr:unnamed protein product [Gongylonema pulchrum]